MLQKYKKRNRFTRGTGDIACKSSMKIWFYMLALNNTHRENWVLLNSLQYFTEIEAWLLFPTFFLYLRNKFPYRLMSQIKESRCLKNVIHQISRNEWLLLSAFLQGLRQNLIWFLS